MNNLKVTTIIFAIVVGTLMIWSCKDNKSEENKPMEMTNETTAVTPPIEKISYDFEGSERTSEIVNAYLKIKNALVADDEDSAKEAGNLALKALENFDIRNLNAEQQKKINSLISVATTNAKDISNNDIKRQRKAFKQLSEEMTKIIAIAGTNTKLYEQFCPMYERGSIWLSAEQDIKNPFYGNKMLTCGTVKKEIN